MAKSPVSDRMAKAEARYGATTKGTAQKAKPVLKVKPSGNPLKGKVGAKLTYKF